MENYEKTKEKKMICKARLGSGSQLCVGKKLTAYNVHPKTVPLIE